MAAKAKEKIMRSAEELFLRKGYHGTGTNAIIEHAGISKGSFFYHFPEKTHLIKETLEQYFDNHLALPLQKRFEKHKTAKQALLGFIDDLSSAYRSMHYSGGCLLGNMTLELSDSDKDMGRLTATMFDSWRSILRDELEGVDLAMDTEEFITLYIASIEGVTMTIRAHKSRARAGREFKACKALVEMAFGV